MDKEALFQQILTKWLEAGNREGSYPDGSKYFSLAKQVDPTLTDDTIAPLYEQFKAYATGTPYQEPFNPNNLPLSGSNQTPVATPTPSSEDILEWQKQNRDWAPDGVGTGGSYEKEKKVPPAPPEESTPPPEESTPPPEESTPPPEESTPPPEEPDETNGNPEPEGVTPPPTADEEPPAEEGSTTPPDQNMGQYWVNLVNRGIGEFLGKQWGLDAKAPEVEAIQARQRELEQRRAEQLSEADYAATIAQRDEDIQAAKGINLTQQAAASQARQQLGGAAGQGAAARVAAEQAYQAGVQAAPQETQAARARKDLYEREAVTRRNAASETGADANAARQKAISDQRSYENMLKRNRDAKDLALQSRLAQMRQEYPGKFPWWRGNAEDKPDAANQQTPPAGVQTTTETPPPAEAPAPAPAPTEQPTPGSGTTPASSGTPPAEPPKPTDTATGVKPAVEGTGQADTTPMPTPQEMGEKLSRAGGTTDAERQKFFEGLGVQQNSPVDLALKKYWNILEKNAAQGYNGKNPYVGAEKKIKELFPQLQKDPSVVPTNLQNFINLYDEAGNLKVSDRNLKIVKKPKSILSDEDMKFLQKINLKERWA